MSERFEIRAGTARRLRENLVGILAPIVILSAIGVVLFMRSEGPFALAGLIGLGIVGTGFQIGTALARNRTEVVVEPPGIRLGEVKVPWPSIWQVVVMGGGPEAAGLGVRLRRGAPPPDGVRWVVYDPEDEGALHVRRAFKERVDAAGLAAAVRAFAPPQVELVYEDGPRGPHRPAGAGGGRREATAVVTGVRMRDHASHNSRHFTYKPHPVVSFVLPDGRHVIAETVRPGLGGPGERVPVSYDAADPADVWVLGGKPRSTRRWTSL